ncbi:TPA: hypothetical protein ACOQ31_004469 [Bacillus cereus]|nr:MULTISPECIES: hypothetical protein [Bacillus]KKC52801.1 hypothetical protein OA45_04922 [Bacillus sp. UMTAT18]KXY58267.1 hypothetical protein AT275_21745 [Bacillus cereus]MCC2417328.1 hypothetical protein [Bacillus pacificus]MCC2474398.1 hypothetical protein [Bacillus pacificus]MCE7033973.1 hypothetical protein [Bacillus cereus]
MIFLKSTELKFKNEGYSKCQSIFNEKIEKQKRIFDEKARGLVRNLDKKEQLIKDLLLMLQKEKNKPNKDPDYINTLEKSIYVLQEDYKNLAEFSANNVLQSKGIPTQVKLLE